MKIKWDMRKAVANYNRALAAMSKLTGLDPKKIVDAEAGIILKTCAAKTKVATAETVRTGARLRALRGSGLTSGKTTINAGARAVFVRFAGCNLWSGREDDRAAAACRFCDTDFVGMDGPGGGRFADEQDGDVGAQRGVVARPRGDRAGVRGGAGGRGAGGRDAEDEDRRAGGESAPDESSAMEPGHGGYLLRSGNTGEREEQRKSSGSAAFFEPLTETLPANFEGPSIISASMALLLVPCYQNSRQTGIIF